MKKKEKLQKDLKEQYYQNIEYKILHDLVIYYIFFDYNIAHKYKLEL